MSPETSGLIFIAWLFLIVYLAGQVFGA